jgi:hypothetical protein
MAVPSTVTADGRTASCLPAGGQYASGPPFPLRLRQEGAGSSSSDEQLENEGWHPRTVPPFGRSLLRSTDDPERDRIVLRRRPVNHSNLTVRCLVAARATGDRELERPLTGEVWAIVEQALGRELSPWQRVRADALKERRKPYQCAEAAIKADLLAPTEEIAREDELISDSGVSSRAVQIEKRLAHCDGTDADNVDLIIVR